MRTIPDGGSPGSVINAASFPADIGAATAQMAHAAAGAGVVQLEAGGVGEAAVT